MFNFYYCVSFLFALRLFFIYSLYIFISVFNSFFVCIFLYLCVTLVSHRTERSGKVEYESERLAGNRKKINEFSWPEIQDICTEHVRTLKNKMAETVL